MSETVGVLGGTGPAGRGVAVRLAAGGRSVVIGSRDAARAAAVADAVREAAGGEVSGGTNAAAAAAGVVIVATPWESALDVVTPLADALADKVIVSMVNALVKQGRELVPLLSPRGSMAAEIAAVLSRSRVTAAFHHLPAAEMEDLTSSLAADVFVCGDDAAARRVTVEMTNAMPGLRAVEVGSLGLAGAIESFTAVCISVNIRHRAHTYLRLAGLAE